MLCQFDYRDFLQALAIWLAQVLAGRRINLDWLAFTSKAILRQNTSDNAICQLCLSFPLNNSKILGNGLTIPLRKMVIKQSFGQLKNGIQIRDKCRLIASQIKQSFKHFYSEYPVKRYHVIFACTFMSSKHCSKSHGHRLRGRGDTSPGPKFWMGRPPQKSRFSKKNFSTHTKICGFSNIFKIMWPKSEENQNLG